MKAAEEFPKLPPFLTADQVAELLNVSSRWVRANFHHGRVSLGHRTIRWRRKDVLDFLKGFG